MERREAPPRPGSRRYWAERVDVTQGTVWLDAVEARHVGKVLRQNPGDTIEVIDGSGRRFVVELLPERRSGAAAGLAARIVTVHPSEPELPPLVLAVPMIRWPRLEEMLSGAVQLGTTHIVLWSAANANFHEPLTAGRRARLTHILRAATTQSLGLRLPELSGPIDLDALVARVRRLRVWVAHGPLSIAERLGAAAAAEAVPASGGQALPAPGGRALVIGPEGGLRDSEVDALQAAGAAVLDLGPRRLRTEVAAIAGLAILGACAGSH